MEEDMAIKYRNANSVLQISRYSIDDEKYQLTIYSEKKIHYFLKVKKMQREHLQCVIHYLIIQIPLF